MQVDGKSNRSNSREASRPGAGGSSRANRGAAQGSGKPARDGASESRPTETRDQVALSREAQELSPSSRIGELGSALADWFEPEAEAVESPETAEHRPGLSGRIEAAADGAAGFIEGAVDTGAALERQVRELGVEAIGNRLSRPLDLAGRAAQFLGAETAAEGLQSTAERVRGLVDAAAAPHLERREQLLQGVGDGAADLVADFGGAVAHPVETVRGAGRLAQALQPLTSIPARAIHERRNPLEIAWEDAQVLGAAGGSFLSELNETRQNHGLSGVVGRVGFDVVLGQLTGAAASSSIRTVRAGAEVVDLAGNIADVGQAADAANQVSFQ